MTGSDGIWQQSSKCQNAMTSGVFTSISSKSRSSLTAAPAGMQFPSVLPALSTPYTPYWLSNAEGKYLALLISDIFIPPFRLLYHSGEQCHKMTWPITGQKGNLTYSEGRGISPIHSSAESFLMTTGITFSPLFLLCKLLWELSCWYKHPCNTTKIREGR